MGYLIIESKLILYYNFSYCRDSLPQKAPSSSQRQLCYNARDKYYKCLEENKLANNSEDNTICEQLRKQYHTNCLPSWVLI